MSILSWALIALALNLLLYLLGKGFADLLLKPCGTP